MPVYVVFVLVILGLFSKRVIGGEEKFFLALMVVVCVCLYGIEACEKCLTFLFYYMGITILAQFRKFSW